MKTRRVARDAGQRYFPTRHPHGIVGGQRAPHSVGVSSTVEIPFRRSAGQLADGGFDELPQRFVETFT